MTCPECGCTAPADPQTGYDADDLCPDCKDKSWCIYCGDLIDHDCKYWWPYCSTTCAINAENESEEDS